MSLPAAKQNDMVMAVDIHIVMVPSPGGPIPTPLPHPFVGMLDTKLSTKVKIEGVAAAMVGSEANAKPAHIPTPPGTAFQKPPMNKASVFMGSATVFIEGKPAARMGDTCMTCNDPSDLPVGKIISTTATVFIGGPPSLVGQAAQGEKAKQSSGKSGAEAATGEAKSEEKTEDLSFKVTDIFAKSLEGAKYELLLPTGEVKKGSIGADGMVEEKELPVGVGQLRLEGLYSPRWGSGDFVGVSGKPIDMVVETAQIDDGTTVNFEVYYEFEEGAGESIATATGKVSKGIAKATWTHKYAERDANLVPRFVFHAKVGEHRVISPPVFMGASVEAKLVDRSGKAVPNWPCYVKDCQGTVVKSVSDSSGKVVASGLAFGPVRVITLDGAVIAEAKQ